MDRDIIPLSLFLRYNYGYMSGHSGEAEPIYEIQVFEKKSSHVWNTLFFALMMPFLAVPWIRDASIEKTHAADTEGGGGH
ncbi:hypothetical protein HY948_05195 [Candidatus Gottesmanbacteria bacterium]|nr:hypothetical protein [Candidatus Gottesmanbacteria bacterium]